jgi:hypothetical protein
LNKYFPLATFCTFVTSKYKAMRRFFLTFICLSSVFMVISCHNKETSNSTDPNQLSQNLINIPASASGQTSGKLPKIVFTDTTYDFGNITEGDKVTHVFTFKNSGQGDLIISSATASCGCTTPTYPHGVKHSGDTGSISVTFDSKNKSGKVVKAITILSNCQPPYKFLTINANIQPSK